MPVNLEKYIRPMKAILNQGQFTGSHVFEDNNQVYYKTLHKDARHRRWLVAFVQ